MAIDLDGKEDIWTHVTEFANGYKTEIQVLKGDDELRGTKAVFGRADGDRGKRIARQSGALTTVSSVKYG